MSSLSLIEEIVWDQSGVGGTGPVSTASSHRPCPVSRCPGNSASGLLLGKFGLCRVAQMGRRPISHCTDHMYLDVKKFNRIY